MWKRGISGLYNFAQWSWYKPRDCWRGEFCFSCWLQTQLFNTDIASSLDYFIRRKVYLSKLQNVFVQIAECICLRSKLQTQLFNTDIASSLDYFTRRKVYLSKLLNVFVKIAECICPRSWLQTQPFKTDIAFSLDFPIS